MPWAAAMAWKESRSAAEARIRMEQPRVVGGEGAAVMGAAAVITAKNYAARFVPPVPWLLSMRFSSRRRSMTAFDRESDPPGFKKVVTPLISTPGGLRT